MRVRVTNPDSHFHGEQGVICRSFTESDLDETRHVVALDTRGFGDYRLGLSFADWELRVLPEKVEVKS